MNRRQAISSVLATAGWGLLPAQRAFGQSGGSAPISIGLTMPFAGPVKQQGIEFYRGANLCIEAVNERGGIGGRTIELAFLDDSADSAKVKQNAIDLVSEDIVAMMGCLGSAAALSALPVLQSAKVPLFGPLSGAQSLREPFNRYVFHVRASMVDEALSITKHLGTVGYTRYAVIHRADSDDAGAMTELLKRLPASTPRPLVTTSIDAIGSNVAAAVDEVIAKQAQAVLFVGPSYKATAAFIRKAQASGMQGTFYCTSDVGTKALSDELKAAGKGVAITQVMPYPFTPGSPLAGEYLQLMRRAPNAAQHVASYTGIEGYVTAKILVEGLRRAGAQVTSEKLINSIESIQNWNAGGLWIDFGSKEHVGSKFVDMTVLMDDGRVLR